MSSNQLAWLSIVTLVIGGIVRMFKADVPWTKTVPAKWRPLLVLALGGVATALDAVLGGDTWLDALKIGMGGALGAMVGHDVVVTGLRNGKEPFAKGDGSPFTSGLQTLLPIVMVGALLGGCENGLLSPKVVDGFEIAGCIATGAADGLTPEQIVLKCGREREAEIRDILSKHKVGVIKQLAGAGKDCAK